MSNVSEIDPQELMTLINDHSVILIDVRESIEYHEEHIPKALLNPSSRFDPKQIPEPFNKKMVFYCLSGKRSFYAAERWMAQSGGQEAYSLQGGLELWKKLNLPTVLDVEAERQVEMQAYIITGFLVLFGSFLSLLLSTWFIIIPILTGLLLLYSGYAGHCYLSFLLSKLPYNR